MNKKCEVIVEDGISNRWVDHKFSLREFKYNDELNQSNNVVNNNDLILSRRSLFNQEGNNCIFKEINIPKENLKEKKIVDDKSNKNNKNQSKSKNNEKK